MTSNDFDAIFHFWRTIGYCLAIEDEFNLCQGNNDEIMEHCRQIYYEEWIPGIINNEKFVKQLSEKMSQSIVESFSPIDSRINYNAMMKYFANNMDFPSEIVLKKWYEKFCFYLCTFYYRYASKMTLFIWLSSKWFAFKLEQILNSKDSIIKVLNDKYPEAIYSDEDIDRILTTYQSNI